MNLKYLLEGAVSINPILFALSLCETAGVRRGRLSNRMRIPPVSEKVSGGSKQIAVSESAGASPIWQRRASLGCGPSRPTGEVLCRAIVLDRVLIGDRVTTCRISTL
jgi:hypothetical protein